MSTRQKAVLTVVILFISLSIVHAAPVPDTGQTQSYTDTFGEDSDYTINQHSYTDLVSGIVRDNVTGLEWVQDGNLIKTRDRAFDADGTTGDGCVTWQHALDYVAKLNNENYLGHSDWRLPAIKELSTLINRGRYNPSIDTIFFPGTMASNYWSSTTYAYSSTNYAWGVDFINGFVSKDDKSCCFNVRAVRSGQSNNYFVDNGDGTISDSSTGLMWQKATATGTYIWEQALTYCESLILNNDGQWTNGTENNSGTKYSDWRLPNTNELQSIVDYSSYNPSIDTIFFPGTVTSAYWSSTNYAGDMPDEDSTLWAWYVHSSDGSVGSGPKNIAYYYVRAVRGATPTLIKLSIFEAIPKAGKVILDWQTESEIDNAGFNLYRSESENGEYIKINDSLIPAQGSPTQGASYTFTDDGLQNRKIYYYMLEDIDLSGTATIHGPVSETPRFIYSFSN